MKSSGVADSIDFENKKTVDINGMVQINGNPISKVGVFDYSGDQIDPLNEDPTIIPDQIYKVYRPEEVLSDPDCIESFKLLPWTDDHYAMIGVDNPSLADVGETGVQGVIGEDVYYQDGFLKANIKVFTQKLANLIKKGKKELSIGYKCVYDRMNGVWNGLNYDFIQKEIRGNHVALVDEGRCGSDVAVLDSKMANIFKLTIDQAGLEMAENKKEEAADQEVEIEIEKDDATDMEMGAAVPEVDAEEIKKSLTMEMLADQISALAGQIASLMPQQEAAAEDEEEKMKAMDSKIAGLQKVVVSLDSKVAAYKKDAFKAVFEEAGKREELAGRLRPHIGSFDSSKMNHQDVAEYGIKALGLSSDVQKGSEISSINAYLKAKNVDSAHNAFDSKVEVKSDQISKYLSNGE